MTDPSHLKAVYEAMGTTLKSSKYLLAANRLKSESAMTLDARVAGLEKEVLRLWQEVASERAKTASCTSGMPTYHLEITRDLNGFIREAMFVPVST